MRVAIQGEPGSFSHAAAMQLVARTRVISCATSREVFAITSAGKADGAVIPIENSLAGSVAEYFDLLLSHPLHIQRELRLRIEHNLIAAPGVRFADIRRVLSHPVALEQCRKFFLAHRKLQPVPFYDTAGSVKHVTEQRLRDAAAIAGRKAAQEYGGKILRRGLEDHKQNFTRFFLLGRGRKVLPGANKTSIVFATKNVAGALFKALSVFALRDISLSKIESRPVPGHPWEYVFFADLLCGQEKRAQQALKQLGDFAEFVRVLGVYRAA
ncbi:MAG: prephenate dehydratase [Acidobacteriales bacterium]|nr:prephenate dehydratase [Terriglobales bacterium]